MTALSVLTSRSTTICLLSQIFIIISAGQSENQFLDNNRFSDFDWALSKAVGGSINENVVISPISLKLVLAMLYEGAQGNTSRQLEDALNLARDTRAYTTQKFSDILKSLEYPSSEYDLDLGTKLFVEKKTRINPRYEETLSRVYNASVQKVDFSNPGKAVEVINKWAKSVTKGHIQNLISEADAKDSVVLLLLNAIYFKGQWLQPFHLNQTQLDIFAISQSEEIKTEFMNSLQTQKYTESEKLDACILRLPYMGDKFAMYIILPNKRDGLNYLVNTVTPDLLRQLKSTMDDVEVNISLPKFHFDFVASFRPFLEKLGLTDIFNERADLKGITMDNKDNLMVSNVIQKAGILVNEKGSTIYVATQVDLVSKFGEHLVDFKANRPFLFLIEDETTNTVVFLGKVVNPGSTGKTVVDKMPPNMYQNMKPVINQPSYLDNDNQPAFQQHSSQNNFRPLNNSKPLSEVQSSTGNTGDHISIGPGGIMEESSNIHNPSSWAYAATYPGETTTYQPYYPDRSASPVNPGDTGGYYADNGLYIKQSFNQQRLSNFDSELIQKLCSSEPYSNWVVSPSSIKTVLGMVYEGATGVTETELSRILRINKNRTIAMRMLHEVQNELHAPVSQEVQWIMANRLLVSNKLPVLPEYLETVGSCYHASIDQTSFDFPAQTAQEINWWVNNVTRGVIPTLVNPESIDPNTQIVLLNAVYFKGDWLHQFNKKFTQQQCFYVEKNKCKVVNMMNQRAYLRYGFNKPLYAHVIELPYSDTRFSMVIVLPGVQGGLIDVIKDLPYNPILPFIDELKPVEVQLALPSFSVEYSKDLSSTIANMEARSLFSNQADLRFMFGPRKGKISSIIHKAKIIVNEKGTEAGAGSAAVIVPLMNSQLLPVSVNQPFLFYLRDRRTGFLFSGLITDPTLK